MIARNILFNVFGGSWTIILYLLIVPVQIKFLGIDAYGLLAFISTLQVVFSLFDFGLSTTLAREVAIDTTPDLQQTRQLLQTLLLAYTLLGGFLGATLILGSNWLVHQWLELGSMPPSTASKALQFAGIAIALRWPVSLLSAVLIGRGRFARLNILRVGAVTLAVAGGIAVILTTGSLVAFAAWNALAALVEIVCYFIACFRQVPEFSLRPRFARPALDQMWRFARDVGIITTLSTILIQSDRVLLSRLEPIDQFGYYTLAYNILFGLAIVQGFVTTAMLPAFAATFQRGAKEELTRQYFLASQGLLFVFIPAIAVLIFFGGDFLRVWTTATTAASSVQILQVLAPAFLLNAVMAITSTLAIATGLTTLIVRFNAFALLLYLPSLYVAILHWGPIGAATAWLVFNIVNLVGLLPFIQHSVMGRSRPGWYLQGILPLAIAGVAVFGLARLLLRIAHWRSDAAVLVMCIAAGVVYALVGLQLLDPVLREKPLRVLRNLWSTTP